MNDLQQARPADPAEVTLRLAARIVELTLVIGEVVAEAAASSTAADAGAEAAQAEQIVAFLHRWCASVPVRRDEADDDPIGLLARRFRLTAAEVDLIVLAGLPDEHEGLASTIRALSPSGEPQVTVGLAANALARRGVDRDRLRAVLAEGGAVRHQLLRVDGNGPMFERPLLPADRLWEALHGLDAWPDRLAARPAIGPLAGYAAWLEQPASRRAVDALRAGDEDSTVLLSVADEAIALGRCAALARAAGVRVVAAELAADDDTAAHLLVAHAAVRGAVPLMLIRGGPTGSPPVLAAPAAAGPALVCAPPGSIRLPQFRPVHAVPVAPLSIGDVRDAWRAALPEFADHAATLAARHPIDPALIAQVALDANAAVALPADPATPPLAGVSALIRARAGIVLPAGMELVRPQVPWRRLVLPDEAALQLRDAVQRVEMQDLVLDDWRVRETARAARGVRLLFTGAPGTGKSIAAEVVATALGTDLLLVDVSQVVSKWIGETEKNLAAAFDVAERSQAVLLLDEADALFGSRTEIVDANDRYANMETAYLLQRLDRFDGLAILATNLRQNIDAAFLRRMDFVVDFPTPDIAGRRELWELHLPPGRMADDIDLDVLARLYPVTGGWIRNAAVAASFLAAAAGDTVRSDQIIVAMRREYAKAAQPFPGEPTRRRDDH